MSVTFEEIIRAWMLHYDDRLPSDRKERREAFIILLGNLADHGYSKEELNSSRKEKIIRSCVNPNHKNKSKLRKWISIVVNDLEAAILIFYPTIKIRDNVVTDEMSTKLENMERKAEEQKALKTADDGEEEESTDDQFSIEDKDKLDIDVKKPITDGNVIETTEEMLDQMDGPEAIWDEHLIKELGIKIYE